MKKRLSCFLLFTALILLSAYPASAVCTIETPTCTHDADGDCYGLGTGCSGEDCNDNDPLVNPGITEQCGNGIDDDCDGEIDETSIQEPCETCIDFDRDSYGSRCPLGEDCNDADATVNPRQDEDTFDVCIDGKDNNCNGLIDQDDANCAAFYSTPEELAGAGGTGGCAISNPQWITPDGDLVTAADPGENIFAVIEGSDCEGVEVMIAIQKHGEAVTVDDIATFFGEFEDENGNAMDNYAIYQTTAPTEPGKYVFTATSDYGSVTSSILMVGEAPAGSCEVQWDCSAIPYGDCTDKLKSRDVCPGNEDSCCTDETACECTAMYPEGDCTEYTYAEPQYQKSCAGITGGERAEREEEEEEEAAVAEAGLPLIPIITIAIIALAAIGGAAYYFATKKPAAQVPASLINYVKAARAKNIPDESIKEALQKSGWKPEQISAALKAK